MTTSVQLSKLAVLLTKEDHQFFAKLESTYRQQFRPADAVELTLFNQLVLAAWNVERTNRLEANLCPESDPLLDQAQAAVFARIANYRQRAERTFHKCLKELRSLAAKPILQNEPKRLRYKLFYYHHPTKKSSKTGQDVLCPCRSGKKYKVCCFSKAAPSSVVPPSPAEEVEPTKAA